MTGPDDERVTIQASTGPSNWQVEFTSPITEASTKKMAEQSKLFARGLDAITEPIKSAATITADLVAPGISTLTANIYPMTHLQESKQPPHDPDSELPPLKPKTVTRYYMEIVDDGPGEMLEVVWIGVDGRVVFHDMDHSNFTPHWASVALAEKFGEAFIREVEGI